jgi:hypothetical protein
MGPVLWRFTTIRRDAFDLYHYRLNGLDLTFEQSTVIQPGQYLVVVADALRAVQTYGTALRVAAQWDAHAKTTRNHYSSATE